MSEFFNIANFDRQKGLAVSPDSVEIKLLIITEFTEYFLVLSCVC